MADLYKELNAGFEKDLAGEGKKSVWKKIAFLLLVLGAAGAGVSAILLFPADSGKAGLGLAKRPANAAETPAKNNFSFSDIIKLPFSESAELKKDKAGRTNVLLLGMSGAGYESPELTDTILIASVGGAAEKPLTLISLPRDLYVKIPNGSRFAKLNSLYLIGKKETPENPFALAAEKASEISGLDLHYFAAVDLSALSQAVDALGGINVRVPEDLRDPNFPTRNFGSEIFEVKQGWRYFDGQTAAKYVRSRHTKFGDFDRIKRQQQVILALRNKLAGLNPITDLPKLFSLLDALKKNFASNLTLPEMKTFWNIAKNFNQNELAGIVIDAGLEKNLLGAETVQTSSGEMFILRPLEGLENYDRIKEYVKKQITIDI